MSRRFRIVAAAVATMMFVSCTERVGLTNQSVYVRLVLPPDFSAQTDLKVDVIVDELSTADGGLFSVSGGPLRGKTEEGFDAEQDIAQFDADPKLEWRLRVLSNPFGAQPRWGVWVTGTITESFRVVGRLVAGRYTTVAEGSQDRDTSDAGIQFGPAQRSVEIVLTCLRPDLCYNPDAGVDAGPFIEDAGTGTDAGADAGADAGEDAGTGADAGADAGTGADAGPDAGADAGVDAGPACTGIALRASANDWLLTDAGCSQGSGCQAPSLRWASASGKWAVAYQADVTSPATDSKILGLEFVGISDAGLIEGATLVTELAVSDAGYYPTSPELFWDNSNSRYLLLLIGGTNHGNLIGPVFMRAFTGGFSIVPNSTRQVSCQQGACGGADSFHGAAVDWNGSDYGVAYLSNAFFYFARLQQDVTLGLVPNSETKPVDGGVNSFGGSRFLAWASFVSEYGIAYEQDSPPITKVGRISDGGSGFASASVGASGPPPPGSATIAWNPVANEFGLVYIQGTSGSEFVRFARVNTSGTTVAGPIILDSTVTAALIIDPTIAVATNGDYGVAWGFNPGMAADSEIRFCLVHRGDSDATTCAATRTRVSGPTGSTVRAKPSIDWSSLRREWGIAWHGNASPNSIFFNAVVCQ